MKFKPITLLLVGFNIFIFGMMFMKYGTAMTSAENVYNSGGMFGSYFYQNHDWSRLITPAFVHIGFQHLLFNMIALWSASSVLENIYGSFKTLLIYLITAVTGNAFAMFFTPTTVVAGASTSIFGMFAVLATLSIVSQNSGIKNVGVSYMGLILVNLLYNLVTPGVSIAGHIGGAVGGILIALMLNSKYEQFPWLRKLIAVLVLIVVLLFLIFKPF